MNRNIFLLIFVFIFSSYTAEATTLHGNIYDFDLNIVKNSIIIVDSEPKQTIVAKEGETLVFIEVKSRNDDRFMPLYETINKRKKDALIRAANYFITANHFNNRTFRIDLATYDKEKNKINYYRNILD